MGAREIAAGWFLIIVFLIFFFYFIIRPLSAIGDIPNEIRRLRESVDKLIEELKGTSGGY